MKGQISKILQRVTYLFFAAKSASKCPHNDLGALRRPASFELPCAGRRGYASLTGAFKL
jgi:hypothetical protein